MKFTLFERLKDSLDDLGGRKKLIRAAGITKGRVLDIGTGECGCMSFFLARRGFDVTGVDSSSKAVQATSECAKKRRFRGSYQGRIADAEKLPFKEGEFEAVIAYHTLHHVAKPAKVIDEMFRVCKVGGFVLVADMNEKGKKAYKHKHDAASLLRNLESLITSRDPAVEKLSSKYNEIFICRKGHT